MLQSAGIHHITAFVQDAQKNVDFYTGVLGLRMVKKTINFDAPEVYHLYYGDREGTPGTIITFFPQSQARQGTVGGGQAAVTVYAVPVGSLDYWRERLASYDISFEETQRFGEIYLHFQDYSGLVVELTEREGGPQHTWAPGGVPADKAVKGFGGSVLLSLAPNETRKILEGLLGFKMAAEENGWVRYLSEGDIGNVIDINTDPVPAGRGGAGTVHHIAWRAKDFEEHEQWRSLIEKSGYHPTPVVDRQYFNAIYFREPGGILFEIATDPPGFANDEPKESMGEKLMLPSWYEPHREEIMRFLPPIQVPSQQTHKEENA
ncbi:ring-cleaving dioxygenase [Paenibacillus sp. JX-17]|uniref:Ring-cleaving dioxygenase n=1 Tax=Paenibacillus lacisoli TaxID=3064525 RepID=A0ABT9CE38_9BACL|nr:ring-cleaving dioxygenase [Paenibacillus sp. JX-17]MDO7907544.1 ring-cleaving dioxygenase [Paenibacillus sp. JX-17]